MVINGTTYAYSITGEGEPLLLLHGFTGSKKTWEPFVALWGNYFQVIAVDLLGHGETESPDDSEKYRMEAVCSDLARFLDRLGIVKTDVLGYSMGGRMALSFACLFPERVNKLILESSSPGLEGKDERRERVKSDEALAAMIEEKGVEQFVAYWENIPLFQSQKTLSSHLRDRIKKERLAQNPKGLANSLRGMGTGVQPSCWGSLATLHNPVQIIVGERDEKFCRIGKRMVELLPNARYTEVRGAGHAIHVEQGEIFGKIVMDFLKNEEGKYGKGMDS